MVTNRIQSEQTKSVHFSGSISIPKRRRYACRNNSNGAKPRGLWALPLLYPTPSTVQSRRRFFTMSSASLSKAKPFSFAVRFCVKPRCPNPQITFSSCQFPILVKPQLNPILLCSNGKVFSRGFRVRSSIRGFSSSGSQERVRSGKSLPWLELDEAQDPKRASKESGTSSWEESAKKFRKEPIGVVETRNGGVVEEEVAEEEGEVEDDPRWDKIRARFSRGESERPEFKRWNKQDSWGKKTWKEATGPSPPKLSGEAVYGVGPVLAALSSGRREFYGLYLQEGVDLNKKKKDKKGFERVLRVAERIGLSIKEASKHDLNMVVDNRPHQGLVLDASPLEMERIYGLDPEEDGSDSLWIALDEVMDPQNLGAIIRSAYFFGASGVVLCAKNSAPLSGVVSKASAGSLELMELRYCKNMMQFLTASAENGWRVLGGSVSSRSVPLREVPPGGPTVLVLGSEGTGLRPLVERSCSELIRIPGNIPVDVSADDTEEFRSFLAVESLNVSVATGVLLHHFIGNKNKKDHEIGDDQVTGVIESSE